MRTTIRVDDELLAQAKALAARSHRSLNSLMEDALREVLRRHHAPEQRTHVELSTFGGDGAMPGVDLEDWSTVKRALEDEDIEHLRGGRAADAAG